MNNPQNPLIPQGSLLEQKNQSRARVKIAVFFVLAIHGIGLMALLMQGCRREEPKPEPLLSDLEPTNAAVMPAFVEPTNVAVDTMQPATSAPPTAPVLPEPTVTPVLPPAQTTEYSVLKGDTLSGIASKFGVTVKALQEANPGIEPTRLQIGQKIQVPPPSAVPASTPAAAPVATAANGSQLYTVKSGDTLSSIASRFGTTVRAIRSANNLKTDRILVGQKLKIPGKATAEPGAGTTLPNP
jgi:LysM repeat protein